MYLDNAATTPLTTNVKTAIMNYLNNYGNPSSHYSIGDNARAKLTESRKIVADFINANPSEIIFTSGGSAANNLAIQGWYNYHSGNIYYSPTCHKSITKMLSGEQRSLIGSHLSQSSCKLHLQRDGKVDILALTDLLTEDREPAIVVVEYANSETGVIQPVENIVETAHMFGAHVYLDCTGSISQIPVDVKKLGADMIGFSGHKLGALKGCGVLYVRDGFEIAPLIYGAQEHGLYGGTENMIGIVALAAAVKNYDYSSISCNKRDYLLTSIIREIKGVRQVGGGLPHNLYLLFEGVSGEELMTVLDCNGYQVSTGSACNSGIKEQSPALLALGVPETSHNGIRITLSGDESFGSLDDFVKVLKDSVEWLRHNNG